MNRGHANLDATPRLVTVAAVAPSVAAPNEFATASNVAVIVTVPFTLTVADANGQLYLGTGDARVTISPDAGGIGTWTPTRIEYVLPSSSLPPPPRRHPRH